MKTFASQMQTQTACPFTPNKAGLTTYSDVTTIFPAPSQRRPMPSARRFSLPSTIVAKWLPANWPAFEAKLT